VVRKGVPIAHHRRQAAGLLPLSLPPGFRFRWAPMGGPSDYQRGADHRCPSERRCRNARVAYRGNLARAHTGVLETRSVAPAESPDEAAELLDELPGYAIVMRSIAETQRLVKSGVVILVL
jgi:hypothetical protein